MFFVLFLISGFASMWTGMKFIPESCDSWLVDPCKSTVETILMISVIGSIVVSVFISTWIAAGDVKENIKNNLILFFFITAGFAIYKSSEATIVNHIIFTLADGLIVWLVYFIVIKKNPRSSNSEQERIYDKRL